MGRKPNVSIIGAGQTGRGFIGRLLYEQGIDFSLIDNNIELISKIRQEYIVQFFGEDLQIHIKPKEALHTEDSRAFLVLKNADVIFVSVGKNNISEIAHYLEMVEPKSDVVILVCENMKNAAKTLKNEISFHNNGITECIIFCTTTAQDETLIFSEKYNEIPYNGELLTDECNRKLQSDVPFLAEKIQFRQLMIRKLYTYNTATAILSFLGLRKGYVFLHESAADKEIASKLFSYYEIIGEALCKEYHLDKTEQQNFAKQSFDKFSNTLIEDPIARNIRKTLEKIMPDERLIGPLRLLSKYNFSSEVLNETIASALVYIEKYCSDKSIEDLLLTVCEVSKNNPLYYKLAGWVVLVKEMDDSLEVEL